MLFSAGSKMNGSCRFGAPAAMIRHLVVGPKQLALLNCALRTSSGI
jgi:hypothetical protein